MRNKPVVLYGAGYRGGQNFQLLSYENIHIQAFSDKDANNFETYFGLEVYSMAEAVDRYSELPFVVCIDNEDVRMQVVNELKERGVDAYSGVEAYYQGEIEADVDVVSCGDAASFDIIADFLHKGDVAFCFGIGFDFSFECELIDRYGMNVYAFDPSPEVVSEMDGYFKRGFQYYPYGLSDIDDKKCFYKPSSGQDYSEYFASWTKTDKVEMQVYRLETIMSILEIDRLNLLKMDIEGSEFVALPDILSSNLKIDQICIETHARIFSDSVERMRMIRDLFKDAGYLLVSNSVEEQTWIYRDLMKEID